jgi:hypothetical protein
MPSASSSPILGPAYTVAKTELGLHLAKLILHEVSNKRPRLLVNWTETENIIQAGDQLCE